MTWSAGYAVFAALTMACGAVAVRRQAQCAIRLQQGEGFFRLKPEATRAAVASAFRRKGALIFRLKPEATLQA